MMVSNHGRAQPSGCLSNGCMVDLQPGGCKSRMTDKDRIEKRIILRAPRPRVWRAIADPEEFGAWFGVKLEGGFVEGATIRGKITHPGYEHLTMELQVERIEPERYFAYRWRPYAVDPAVDYSSEPM